MCKLRHDATRETAAVQVAWSGADDIEAQVQSIDNFRRRKWPFKHCEGSAAQPGVLLNLEHRNTVGGV